MRLAFFEARRSSPPILDALEQKLARADRAETRALAGRPKSGFAQIYVMFGDFGAG